MKDICTECTVQEEERLGYQLKKLDNLFRKTMEADMRQNGNEDLTMINGWIIGYLARNEGKDVYQKDLERKFQIGKSSLAGTLRLMEEKGFIKRLPVLNDRRLKKVVLTEKGHTYTQKMEECKERMEEKLAKGISEEELSLFRSLLQRMQDNLSRKEKKE